MRKDKGGARGRGSRCRYMGYYSRARHVKVIRSTDGQAGGWNLRNTPGTVEPAACTWPLFFAGDGEGHEERGTTQFRLPKICVYSGGVRCKAGGQTPPRPAGKRTRTRQGHTHTTRKREKARMGMEYLMSSADLLAGTCPLRLYTKTTAARPRATPWTGVSSLSIVCAGCTCDFRRCLREAQGDDMPRNAQISNLRFANSHNAMQVRKSVSRHGDTQRPPTIPMKCPIHAVCLVRCEV